MDYKGFMDLKVYQLSYKLALEIFEATKTYPKEELYSLTDQIRDHQGLFLQILPKHCEKENIQKHL
jgi:hypothetical protein